LAIIQKNARPTDNIGSYPTIKRKEFNLGKTIIKVGFWFAFWVLEGVIVGFVGGLIFGLSGFGKITSTDEWISVGIVTLTCSGIGALMGIMLGIFGWFNYNIMKQTGNESMGRPLDRDLGKRVFSKIFGSYDRY
jgi:hypothetical protein